MCVNIQIRYGGETKSLKEGFFENNRNESVEAYRTYEVFHGKDCSFGIKLVVKFVSVSGILVLFSLTIVLILQKII